MEENMFWHHHRGDDGRRLRRLRSMFVTSGTLFIFLVATAIAFTIIVIPTLHSFTSHILKPNSVKKSWDSLNLILVLFAIFCGFLRRNNNEEDQIQSFSHTPQISQTQLYDYSDRTPYYRLRSCHSYPDLQVATDERWRFYDDTHVDGYRRQRTDEKQSIKNRVVDAFEKVVPSSPPLPESPPPAQVEKKRGTIKNVEYRRHKPETGEEERRKQSTKNRAVETFEKQNMKNRAVDSFVKEVHSAPPLPPPPPTAPVGRKSEKSNYVNGYQQLRPKTTGGKEEEKQSIKNREMGSFEKLAPSAPPLPAETSGGKSKKKRASATREFLTSLKGKKKKQRNKSFENFESIRNSELPSLPTKPPPPPPPPPPSSVFRILFSSKKSKQKNYNSASQNRVSKTEQIHSNANANVTLKPNKTEYSNALEAGNESPLIPIPPPPPPPPFKIPAWKFRKQGDFVRIDSISSSSSDSPEIDDASNDDDDEKEEEPRNLSIDIDTEAATFIENFKAGLRIQRSRGLGASIYIIPQHYKSDMKLYQI